MRCSKCGQNLSDETLFCPYCGERIGEPIQPEVPRDERSTEPIRLETPLVEIVVDPVSPEESQEEPVEETTETETVEDCVGVEESPTLAQEAEDSAESESSSRTYDFQEDRPAEAIPPKKKSKSMLFITIVAAVLVLAVLASCVLFFVRAASPEVRLLRAVNGSMEDLTEITSNAKTLHEMAAQIKSYEEGTSTTTSYLINTSEEHFNETTHITVTTHKDYVNHRILVDGELSIVAEYEDYEEFNYDVSLEYQIYADAESLVLTLPDLLNDSYKIPMDQFGEKLLASEFGELIAEELDEETLELLRALDIDLTTLMDPKWTELCPEEYQHFVDSVSVEESDWEIPNAVDIEQLYELRFDMDALEDLLLATAKQYVISTIGDVFEVLPEELSEELQPELDEAKESLESLECTVFFGVGDDKLRALYTEVKYDNEVHDMTLVLAGKENVWEDILLYADGEVVLEGGFIQRKHGFTFSLEAEGEKLAFHVDDQEQKIRFRQNGKDLTCMNYDLDGEVVTLGYTIEEAGVLINYSAEIEPLEDFDAPEDCVDLFALTEEELEDLSEELMEALWTFTE